MSKQNEYGYRLADTFSTSAGPGFFSTFDTTEQAPRQIDVTDIAVGKTFHVEMPKNLSVTSVQGPNVDSGVDLGKMRAGVESVRDDYVKTDATIKDVVIEAAHQVMGKEAGDHLMGQLLPKGSPTHGQAAAMMVGPAGVIGTAGAMWSAFNSIQQQRNATPPPEMLAQMDKILSHIQEASQKQSTGEMDMGQSQKPLKVPQELDFSSITAQELMGFMERQVEDDPVMQETEKALDALDHFEKNQDYAEENDNQVVTAAKIEDSIESGNDERLAELVGNDGAENIKSFSAFAVEFIGAGIQNMPQVILDRNNGNDPVGELRTAQEIQRDLDVLAAAKAPLPGFDREAELLRAASANLDQRPGMAA